MGSIAAMRSLDEVLEKHGDEIRNEYKVQVPQAIMPLFERVDLENELYGIRVTWVFKDGGTLEGPTIDIDVLADVYSDCDVGY